jgi:hypothetical protein
MDPAAAETFTCAKYHCTLTRQACADRQAARTLHAYGQKPTYPGCQDCDQGMRSAKGILSAVKPRVWGRTFNNQNIAQEGKSMGYPNKIDNDQLQKLIAEGKFVTEIAEAFGCDVSAVRTRIKRLGLTPNYRRPPKGAAPAPVRETRPLSQPFPTRGEGFGGRDTTPGQVIPVTLRLTVEVNVRVSTEGVHVA